MNNDNKIFEHSIKLSKICKKVIFDDYTILIGRNAMSNDILSIEVADEEDIFLHAKGIPGSHVIIRKKGNEDVPMDVIQRAAELAALNSKGKNLVEVVYTEAKNVSKNNNQRPGQVSVNYDKSNFIKVNI